MLFLALLACLQPNGVQQRPPLAHEAWEGGFRVEPPVPLPRPSAHSDVEVWLALPTGARVVERADGARVLAYGAGTRADRVEFRSTPTGRRVVDVRGTTLDAEGRHWHHVYQPISSDPAAALIGVQWPADDPDQAERAVDRFLAALASHGMKHLDKVRAKLDCESCHLADRPDNVRPYEHGLVARGTDAAGFFTPSTLLTDEAPAESYGLPLDAAPFFHWRCAEREVAANTVRCDDGTNARVHVDAEAASATQDPRWRAAQTSRARLQAALKVRP